MAFPSITTLFRALSYLSKRAQLAGASFVEGVVWGFSNAFGLFLEAYLGDPKFASQPHAASLLPLIGPLSSGIIHCSGVYPRSCS